MRAMVFKHLMIIAGPTGAGKTDFVNRLAASMPIEIINGDMGQMYSAFAIGTAKPQWRSESTPHHLFDSIDTPASCTSAGFRRRVSILIEEIWDRGSVPVIVGGSSFYLLSLFFPPQAPSGSIDTTHYSTDDLFQKLQEIDVDRARAINPSDRYRIERALAIHAHTGHKASSYLTPFEPLAPTSLIWLTRDRTELYDRIDKRTLQMINEGWMEEVRLLQGTAWAEFLKEKKIIGYDILLDVLEGKISKNDAIALIQQRTRNYAKRQETFWRSFKRKVMKAQEQPLVSQTSQVHIMEFNLTHGDVGGYIKQLKNEYAVSGADLYGPK